jgi:TetR/AcrR family transcriptional regulator, cholesterol catabolism regulator
MGSLAREALSSAAQRDRHRRILDTAVALASEGGFDAVRMRLVAERADVALGTLYRYFPSKIHLLVCALGRELERANQAAERQGTPGDTSADRVTHVLGRTTQTLQRDPYLTEALTRAFMFADASVSREIEHVERQVSMLLLRAMRPDGGEPEAAGDRSRAVEVARVVGDVWLASLVKWVTGRSAAEDVAGSVEVAVRLLLR